MGGWNDKIEGKIKDVKGSVTGNEQEQAEGKAQESWGDMQNKAREMKHKGDDVMEDMKSEREPVASGTGTSSGTGAGDHKT